MRIGCRSEIEEIDLGDLLRRQTFAEMEEEDQDVAFSISPLEGSLQYSDQIVFSQFIRIVADYPTPALEFFHNKSVIERFGPRATFEGTLAAQLIDCYAGCDMHQVDLGLELRRSSEAAEGCAFILEHPEVDFLKEIGDDFPGGRPIDAEPPISLINAVRQAGVEPLDELLPIPVIIKMRRAAAKQLTTGKRFQLSLGHALSPPLKSVRADRSHTSDEGGESGVEIWIDDPYGGAYIRISILYR